MWPGEIEKHHWLPMVEALGMEEIPPPNAGLTDVYSKEVLQLLATWLADQIPEPNGEIRRVGQLSWHEEKADALLFCATSRPWKTEQFPPLAEWINKNEKQIDLIVEASERPCFYSPSPSLLEGFDDGFVMLLQPELDLISSAIRVLHLRAMWHLGEDRAKEAWLDLLSSYRLARMITQNQLLHGHKRAIGYDCSTSLRVCIMLHRASTSTELTQQIRDELYGLNSIINVSQAFNQDEQLWLAGFVSLIASGKLDLRDQPLDNYKGHLESSILSTTRVDWNVVLRDLGPFYKRTSAMFQLSTRDEQQKVLEQIENDLIANNFAIGTPFAWFRSVLSIRWRSNQITSALIEMFFPSLRSTTQFVDRNRALSAMTRIASDLSLYRAEHGEYPSELSKLEKALPLDWYSGKSFIYERKEDGGYLLYSVFENGIDDGGNDLGGEIVGGEWVEGESQDVDRNTSDLVIRVPVPAFELPELPSEP